MERRRFKVEGVTIIDNQDAGTLLRKLIFCTPITLLCLAVAAILVIVLEGTSASIELAAWEKTASFAADYNAQSYSQRMRLAPGIIYDLDEDYRVIVGEKPETVNESLTWWLATLRKYGWILAIIVISGQWFLQYILSIDQQYFIADFPGVMPYRAIIPIVGFVGAPFYLKSYFNLRRWEAGERKRLNTTSVSDQSDEVIEKGEVMRNESQRT